MVTAAIDSVQDSPIKFPLSFETRGILYFPSLTMYDKASQKGLESALKMMRIIEEYVTCIELIRQEIKQGGILKKLKAIIFDSGKSNLNIREIRSRIFEHKSAIEFQQRQLVRYSFPSPHLLQDALSSASSSFESSIPGLSSAGFSSSESLDFWE